MGRPWSWIRSKPLLSPSVPFEIRSAGPHRALSSNVRHTSLCLPPSAVFTLVPPSFLTSRIASDGNRQHLNKYPVLQVPDVQPKTSWLPGIQGDTVVLPGRTGSDPIL